MNKTTHVLAAHADDEVLGSGGIIVWYQGNYVVVEAVDGFQW